MKITRCDNCGHPDAEIELKGVRARRGILLAGPMTYDFCSSACLKEWVVNEMQEPYEYKG